MLSGGKWYAGSMRKKLNEDAWLLFIFGFLLVGLLIGLNLIALDKVGQHRAELFVRKYLDNRFGGEEEKKGDEFDEVAFEGMVASDIVGQVMSVSVASGSGGLVEEIYPGFVGLFGTEDLSKDEVLELISGVGDAWVFVDQEGGGVRRLREGFLKVDSWSSVCDELDEEEIWSLGKEVGDELAGVGVDGVWGPVVDRWNDESEVLEDRTCGIEAKEIVDKSLAYVGGMSEAGVVSVVKHFPGLGGTSIDPHVDLGGVEEVDWDVFDLVLDEVDGVMVTHVRVGGDGLPCSLSGLCVGELVRLREEMGWDFLIFSDAMEMEAIDSYYSPVESAYLAIMSGVDVLVYGGGASEEIQLEVYDDLLDRYYVDERLMQRVDESAKRILEWKNVRNVD